MLFFFFIILLLCLLYVLWLGCVVIEPVKLFLCSFFGSCDFLVVSFAEPFDELVLVFIRTILHINSPYDQSENGLDHEILAMPESCLVQVHRKQARDLFR